MELKLHKNAKTTPKIRELIKQSDKSCAQLSKELKLNYNTVLKWRKRETPYDKSHIRNNLNISLTPLEEEIVNFLRKEIQLPLDDIVYVVNQCVNSHLTRSSIYRCLRRHGISDLTNCLPTEKIIKPKERFNKEDDRCGFIHVDVKYLYYAENKQCFLYVAIDRATRYVYVEILDKRNAIETEKFLSRFIKKFPHKIEVILTDNGGEFTDRYANSKIDKAPNKPSGTHIVDILCKKNNIEHRLIKPYKPQTNGMVERFNKRVSEWMKGKQGKFKSKDTLAQYVYNLADNYNKTKLKVINYKSPIESLQNIHNHTELNTLREGQGRVKNTSLSTI